MKLLKLQTILLACLFVFACKSEDPADTNNPQHGSFVLKMNHRFGSDDFETGKEFVSKSGDSVKFTAAKYRLSNISLQKTDGSWVLIPETYFLTDATQVLSNITVSNVPAGEYTAIKYLIGVDSARNVSGAQTGSLSPSEGMYWSWNSGYIFILMEGESPQSTDGGSFAFHVGGFSGVNSALRENTHNFGGAILKVNPNATPQLHIDVDFNEVNYDVKGSPKIHMPGAAAAKFADGFRNAFTFLHIHE